MADFIPDNTVLSKVKTVTSMKLLFPDNPKNCILQLIYTDHQNTACELRLNLPEVLFLNQYIHELLQLPLAQLAVKDPQIKSQYRDKYGNYTLNI